MKERLHTGFRGITIPFSTLFPTSGEAAWISVCENPDEDEVALTKRSDRVMVDLVDLVGPFITRGLHGAIADDTSYRVGSEVLEVSRESIVDVVAGFDVEVWGEMVIEVAASRLAGSGL